MKKVLVQEPPDILEQGLVLLYTCIDNPGLGSINKLGNN
jgi:hypothetical protein